MASPTIADASSATIVPASLIAGLLLVPQPRELALEAAFLLDRDPLEHVEPLLELLHLLAQPLGLGSSPRGSRLAIAAAIFVLVADARLEDACRP